MNGVERRASSSVERFAEGTDHDQACDYEAAEEHLWHAVSGASPPFVLDQRGPWITKAVHVRRAEMCTALMPNVLCEAYFGSKSL